MAANRSLTHGLVDHLLAMYMDDEGRIVGLEGGEEQPVYPWVFSCGAAAAVICALHTSMSFN